MSIKPSSGQRAIVLAMLAILAALVLFDHPFAPGAAVSAGESPYADFATPSASAPAFADHPAGRRPAVTLVHNRHRARKHHHYRPAARTIPSSNPEPVPSPEPLDPKAAPVGAVQAYALSLVGPVQFACLLPLWERESGWQWWAANPSGAYGIPQALPGNKMAAAGPDWRHNPYTQVRWGVLDYIDPVYGTACNAWLHEQADGWY